MCVRGGNVASSLSSIIVYVYIMYVYVCARVCLYVLDYICFTADCFDMVNFVSVSKCFLTKIFGFYDQLECDSQRGGLQAYWSWLKCMSPCRLLLGLSSVLIMTKMYVALSAITGTIKWVRYLGPVSVESPSFPGMGIPMLKIRRSRDRLIFNMGIPILVRLYIYHIYILRRPL